MHSMIPIGTRIRFKHTITEDANGDHPEFLLAERGTHGTVDGYTGEALKAAWLREGWGNRDYSVIWDGFLRAGFYAKEGDDFEVCKGCLGKGVVEYSRPPTEAEKSWDGDGPLEAIDCEKPCPQCGGPAICPRCKNTGIASSPIDVKQNLYSNYPCPECAKGKKKP